MIFAGWSVAARIAAPLIVFGLVVAAAWGYGHRQYRAGQADVRAEWDAAKERQRVADAMERIRRESAQQEVAREAQEQLALARTDAAAATAAADRLRNAYTAALKRRCDSAAAAGSPTAEDTTRLLADVQRRIDEAAGDLAGIADERGLAGRACERAYDALTDAK